MIEKKGEERKLGEEKRKKGNKNLVLWKIQTNQPRVMSVFCMDAEDKRWSIHRYIHHTEIDSTVLFRMLLDVARDKSFPLVLNL